jgi:hypothetical protein
MLTIQRWIPGIRLGIEGLRLVSDYRLLAVVDRDSYVGARDRDVAARLLAGESRRAWEWLVRGRGRLVLVGITVLFAVLFVGLLAASFTLNGLGWDYHIYMDRAADFVAGRGFYLPRQLAGPYLILNGDALYPPPAVLLFVPFLYLPPVLYWAIPLAVAAVVIAWHRPAIWAWPIITAIPIWNLYLMHEITKGNPGLWTLAAFSLATVWPRMGPFTALKWGLTPFALFGIWRRDWWIGAGVLLVVCLALAPMWPDYIRVVQDARGTSVDYMIGEYPMMLIPLVAWAAGRRKGRVSVPSFAGWWQSFRLPVGDRATESDAG